MDESYAAGHAHVYMTKVAGTPVTTDALAGRLYLSKSGWLLLSVPNSLVRGAFDALHEPGVELPPQDSGGLNAHITVMKPDEVEKIGPAKITERGHLFRYTLGPVKKVAPAGWDEMSAVWYINVKSQELEKLRKSYGLSGRPHDNKFEFHITIGARRKHVLRENETSKAAAEERLKTVAVDLDGTLAKYDKWRGENHFGDLRPGAKKSLESFHAEGYKIIIYTCRGNKAKVKEWLDSQDLTYDYINENPHQPPGVSEAKIQADVYVDDRAVDARGTWKGIRTETHRRLKAAADLNTAAAFLTDYYLSPVS